MFSTAFNWNAFAVDLSRSAAVQEQPAREQGGAIYFDNGRRYVLGAAGAPGGAVAGLPDAWAAFPLPEGAICPLLAQLALLRGEPYAYEPGTRRVTVGGRVLVGTAGAVFSFSGQGAADMWVAVNRKRGESELVTLAGLPEAAAVAARAAKAATLAGRAVRLVANAARVSDGVKRAAIIREADWYAAKWQS